MKNRIKKLVYSVFLAAMLSAAAISEVNAEEDSQKISLDTAEIEKPDSFSWSGGTGKVEITCEKIVQEKDGVYAEIVFSSDAYTYVKINNEIYYAQSNEGCSVFVIPVELNKNMEIQAMTTRMSEAHEITYTLYIERDNKSHELIETIEPAHAELFQIFKYSDGTSILEIQMEDQVQKVYLASDLDNIPAGTEKEMEIVAVPQENVFHGTEEEIDYKKLIEDKCSLVILTSGPISEEMSEKLDLLGISVIYDCSAQEETQEAVQEWNQMFADLGLLLEQSEKESTQTEHVENISEQIEDAPALGDLICTEQMEMKYAQGFDIYTYQSENDESAVYNLIDIHDVAKYLVVPKEGAIPENIDDNIVILQQPLDNIYLAATSVMSLFDAIDALDQIRLSGTDVSGWYIENAIQKMEDGEILYAGKYSEPDYELLLSEACDLAIESTMIQHTPKVKEMIEDLGIPVLVDYSSYESHPLGRTEWIKLYSVLAGKQKEGIEFFEKQAEIINRMKDFDNTEKTVVFFYVSTDGKVVVRSTEDYIPKMIEIAGGRYAFEELKSTEGKQSSVSMTMEEFYNTAVDADYLIYNASIDSPVETIEELLTKSELFADFKAVKEGNVWGTGKYLYQATDIVGNMIEDIHLMLTDGAEENMTFIFKIK